MKEKIKWIVILLVIIGAFVFFKRPDKPETKEEKEVQTLKPSVQSSKKVESTAVKVEPAIEQSIPQPPKEVVKPSGPTKEEKEAKARELAIKKVKDAKIARADKLAKYNKPYQDKADACDVKIAALRVQLVSLKKQYDTISAQGKAQAKITASLKSAGTKKERYYYFVKAGKRNGEPVLYKGRPGKHSGTVKYVFKIDPVAEKNYQAAKVKLLAIQKTFTSIKSQISEANSSITGASGLKQSYLKKIRK
jgi:hypothetical protein